MMFLKIVLITFVFPFNGEGRYLCSDRCICSKHLVECVNDMPDTLENVMDFTLIINITDTEFAKTLDITDLHKFKEVYLDGDVCQERKLMEFSVGCRDFHYDHVEDNSLNIEHNEELITSTLSFSSSSFVIIFIVICFIVSGQLKTWKSRGVEEIHPPMIVRVAHIIHYTCYLILRRFFTLQRPVLDGK